MFLYTKQASAQMRGQSPNMSFDEIANQSSFDHNLSNALFTEWIY